MSPQSIFALIAMLAMHAGLCAAACDSSPAPIKDANTVTLKLYSDDGCCTSFETLSMGVLNECHTSNRAFQSYNMAVGQNMFGRNIHIVRYTDSNCQSGALSSELTNAPNVCLIDSGANFNSVQIVVL